MDYLELTLHIEPVDPGSEIAIALLFNAGYDGFTETDNGIKAYIPNDQFNASVTEGLLAELSQHFRVEAETRLIPGQNWNRIWESGFEPVMITDRVFIRAPFHEKSNTAPIDIVIEPKMSFGTGHHQTTALMVELMLTLDFRNKTVLDMGCGTSVLAIMAEKLGAVKIDAIDTDEWAFLNAVENIAVNNCRNISVMQGDGLALAAIAHQYDIILANINRNVLMDYMEIFYKKLHRTGILLLSGFLSHDKSLLSEKASGLGLGLITTREKDNWAAIALKRDG